MNKDYFNGNHQDIFFGKDISLIHSYDSHVLNVFFKKVAAKEILLHFKNNAVSDRFENIYHLDNSSFTNQDHSLFDLPFLKAINFEELLIKYADPKGILNSDEYQNVKQNISKFLTSMLNLNNFSDDDSELKLDYRLDIKNTFIANQLKEDSLSKKLNFFRLLIKLDGFGFFSEPTLFLFENFDLLADSQHQLEFFELLNKVKKIKNLTIIMNISQAETFNTLSKYHLFESFLMYPDFNNEWNLKPYLTHKDWRAFQKEFAFLVQKEEHDGIDFQNEAFLGTALEFVGFNFFSSKESTLCFSREVFFALNPDKNNKFNLYKIDRILDLIPIIAIMNSLGQTFKLKIIFEKNTLEKLKQTPFIELLNKYRIKWTTVDSSKITTLNNLKEVLLSFIEERQPKLKLDLEQTQTNSIKVIEFVASDDGKEIIVENVMTPVSSSTNPIDNRMTDELEINLEAIIAKQMERLSPGEVKIIYELNNNGLLYPIVTERLAIFFNSIPLEGTKPIIIEDGIFNILKDVTKIRLLSDRKNEKKKTAKPSSSKSHKRTKRWKH